MAQWCGFGEEQQKVLAGVAVIPVCLTNLAGSRTLGKATWVLPSVGRAWYSLIVYFHSPAVIPVPMHGHVLFLASHALRISGRLEPRLTLVAGSLVAPAFVALITTLPFSGIDG